MSDNISLSMPILQSTRRGACTLPLQEEIALAESDEKAYCVAVQKDRESRSAHHRRTKS